MFSETGKGGPWMAERSWARALVHNTHAARQAGEAAPECLYSISYGKCLLNI